MNSEEADSILNNKGCPDCRSGEQQRFQLSCDHIFCLTCVAFSHLKFQQEIKDELKIKCLECGYISKIDENALKLIKQIIKTKILPYVAKAELNSYQSDLKEDSKNYSQSIQASSSKKGSASKGHFSSKQLFNKLQSPKESLSNKKQACPIHSHEELAFICFTCNNSLLCLRCVHQKKHGEHEIKSLLKGIQIVRQKIDLHRMQSKQHIDYLRMWYRRLDDRKILIRNQWERCSQEINASFEDLQRKLEEKSKQITISCKLHFNNLLDDVQSQIQKVSHNIDILNHHIIKLNDLTKSNGSPAKFVRESMNTLNQVDIKKIGNLQINLLQRLSYPSNNIQNHINSISKMLHNLEIQYKFSNSPKPQSPLLQNSKSQQKLNSKDHPFKRVKTNLISLNSSRDKKERKEKKCTRTEQDQKWNKAKASKPQSASKLTKINRQIPHYIMQFFQKPSTKPYQNQIECLVQMNTMQNSFKSASKILSKSHLPAQNDFFQKQKKKDNTTMIKERLQRKTAHPTTKEHKSPNHDNLKKKKFNF